VLTFECDRIVRPVRNYLPDWFDWDGIGLEELSRRR
jgi:hypothetical protein